MALIIPFILRHSCIWSEICVALFFPKFDNNSVPESYQTRSWKWLRNTVAKSRKQSYAVEGSSMYHFAATWVNVLWKSLNRTESSFIEFEEHQRWKVVMCTPRSSPTFLSKLGMSEGSLIGTGGHATLCCTGPFINFDKSGKFKFARKGSFGLIGVWK